MPEEIAARFLERLWELQAARRMSNADLAAALGVGRPYLSRLRRRKRGRALTLELALRAAGVFPELTVFLTPIVVPIMTISDTEGTETGEGEPQ